MERVGSVDVRSSRRKLTAETRCGSAGLVPRRNPRRGVVVIRKARLGVFHGFPRGREAAGLRKRLHDRVDVLHVVRHYTTHTKREGSRRSERTKGGAGGGR